jgi:carotenoid 1,2-hydratase
VPWPSRLRGSVTLRAACRFDAPVTLAAGHTWCPIAPAARVDVRLGTIRWSGPGYLDANHGETPLEQAFTRWDWSRAHLQGGDSAVHYDITRRHGGPLSISQRFGADGRIETVAPPPSAELPLTGWRLARHARSDAGSPARIVRTLTDAPFYARSLVRARWWGEPVTAMHESLSLTRFDTRWVQAMLPFRMPRA